ncbi:MAG: hypothetical protein RLY97_286 [Pseudomonadota bacterium]
MGFLDDRRAGCIVLCRLPCPIVPSEVEGLGFLPENVPRTRLCMPPPALTLGIFR